MKRSGGKGEEDRKSEKGLGRLQLRTRKERKKRMS